MQNIQNIWAYFSDNAILSFYMKCAIIVTPGQKSSFRFCCGMLQLDRMIWHQGSRSWMKFDGSGNDAWRMSRNIPAYGER